MASFLPRLLWCYKASPKSWGLVAVTIKSQSRIENAGFQAAETFLKAYNYRQT